MKFGQPQLLYALLALAVPILIHFFHFRRTKTVYFTNVRFLRQIQQESQAVKRLRHLWILLARLMALAALIFAFAKPYLPSSIAQQTGDRLISLYIDNSFSMEAADESGSLFDLAKKHAVEIATTMPNETRFHLLTNDFEAKHQRVVSKEQLLEFIDDLRLSPVHRNLTDVLAKQQEAFQASEASVKLSYLLSDFQKNAMQEIKTVGDSAVYYYFVPLKANTQSNLYIDSCWFDSPTRLINQPDYINARLVNRSNQEQENVALNLKINGEPKGLENLTIGPDSILVRKVAFTTASEGAFAGILSVKDYPVVFDDDYFFTYKVDAQIPVLEIRGSNSSQAIERLLKLRPEFNFTVKDAQQIDYAQLQQNRLIILNELPELSSGLSSELEKAWQAGVYLWIIPHATMPLDGVNILLQNLKLPALEPLQKVNLRCDALNLQSAFFADVFDKVPNPVDLPGITAYFPWPKVQSAREEYLLKLQNGASFLSFFPGPKSGVYLSATPLNEQFTNFSKHAIFIPSVYKIALFSQKREPSSFIIGKNEAILMEQKPVESITYKIQSDDGKVEFIPEMRIIDGKTLLYPRHQITKAGIYHVIAGNERLKTIAYNYDRLESNLVFATNDQLMETAKNLALDKSELLNWEGKEIPAGLRHFGQGKQLWKWFLVAGLLFLLIEMLLIKFAVK